MTEHTKYVYVPTNDIQYNGPLNEVVLSWQAFALTVPEEYRNDAQIDISYGDDFLEIGCHYVRPMTEQEISEKLAVEVASKTTMLAYYKLKVAELEGQLIGASITGVE